MKNAILTLGYGLLRGPRIGGITTSFAWLPQDLYDMKENKQYTIAKLQFCTVTATRKKN